MQIVIDFSSVDDADLRRQDARDTPVHFPFRVEHEGRFYPDHAWWDFGVVVLSWWVEAVVRLLHGAGNTVLDFMDGDREIAISYDRTRGVLLLRPSRTDLRWEIAAYDFAYTLAIAADQILQKLASVGMKPGGVNDRDMAALRSGVARLQATIDKPTVH